jgi:hypothetical protein
MKTLTMTSTEKATKTIFQNANEGEQCRIASSGDYFVGMDSAKAGTVVKVTDTDMSEAETVKFYTDFYIREWHMNEADSEFTAKQDVKLMSYFANLFDTGEKLLVKVYKSGRVAVTTL